MPSSELSASRTSASATGARRPLPNLIIAGPGKAGTTSLFAYLSRHLDVCAASEKQARYFSPPAYRDHGGQSRVADLDRFHHCGEERYRLEATPSYFYGGTAVIEAIQAAVDDARVIVTLREPVARLWSSYRFWASRLELPEGITFDTFVSECERLRATRADRLRENAAFFGLSGGFYADWLGDWLKSFGSALRVVFFDELVRSPASVMRDLCEWLELDPARLAPGEMRNEYPTVPYRSRVLQRLAIVTRRRASGILDSVPRIEGALRAAYTVVNRGQGRKEMPASTAAVLSARYAPSTQRVAMLLTEHGYGDRLPAWLRRDAGVDHLDA